MRTPLIVALTGVASLALATGCSKSSDNGNKGSAENTTPTAAKTRAPDIKLADPPAPEPKPAPTEGVAAKSRNETAEYVIEFVPPATVAAGAESALTVSVRPKKGWHFNLDFPTSVKVAVPAGMKVASAKLGLGDATSKSEEKGASWAVKVTPEKPGAGTVTCDVKFAVCTETTCDPKKETLAVTLDAK
jgi:hypothetical protein